MSSSPAPTVDHTSQAADLAGPVAVALCLVAGLIVTAVAARFGTMAPFALLALGVLPLVGLAAFQYPVFCVMLVFLAFPIGTVALPGGIFNVVQFVAFAAATIVMLRRVVDGKAPLPWVPVLAWPIALVGWTLLILGTSIDTTLAVKQIGVLIGGIVLALVIVAVCETFGDLRRVLVTFVLVSAGVAVYALFHTADLRSSSGGEVVEGQLTGTFAQPNELGIYCVMMTFVASGVALGATGRRTRYAAVGSVVVLLLALALSFSRGAWLGLAAATVFFLVVLPTARRAAVVFAVPLVGLGILVGSFTASGPTEIQIVTDRIGAFSQTSPYDSRREIWNEALREIKAKPVTGEGPGGFPVASTRSVSAIASVSAVHAHNLALTWAAEAGLPALALLVAFAVSLVTVSRRAARELKGPGQRREHAVLAGLQAALVALLVHGLVDYPLRNAVISMTVWSVIGALLACIHILETSHQPPHSSAR